MKCGSTPGQFQPTAREEACVLLRSHSPHPAWMAGDHFAFGVRLKGLLADTQAEAGPITGSVTQTHCCM